MARGHEVTVYGRDRYIARDLRAYRGMRIVRLPAPRSKYLETVVHSLFAAIHALTAGATTSSTSATPANVPAVILLGCSGGGSCSTSTASSGSGRSGIGRAYYRLCAWLAAARLPVELVTDARVIQAYYRRPTVGETDYFPYGTDLEPVPDDGTLARLGLEPGRYVLYVSRLEPENNAHVVIDAYAG